MKLDRTTIAVLVGAGAFMIWGAGYYTVFDDEAFSTQRYVMPLRELVPSLWRGVEPDPPLYYVLEHGWIALFGVRPTALRGLSIILFLSSLPVLRAAGEAWCDARTGRLAVLLCGLHPLHLFFGFAARWYALMFLCTAVLLLATARIELRGGRRGWMLVWALAATAALYTNYFGACVVALLWLWGIRHGRGGRRGWKRMAGLVLLLYSPWAPALVEQLTRFPRMEREAAAYAATAGRTIVALLAGNLASPEAWYVWGAAAFFAIGVAALVVADLWRGNSTFGTGAGRYGGLAWLVGGCFVSGVASLTMIDKYVMIFSGGAWLAIAAVLSAERSGRLHTVRSAAIGGLCVAWAGCGMNWVLEERWLSLRWLDPIGRVVRDHVYDRLVATHPSVRYYYGCMDPAAWYGRVTTEQWQARSAAVMNPREALHSLAGESGAGRGRICTIRTAAMRTDDADWSELFQWLDGQYTRESEERFLADPTAGLKDRFDPNYRHPPYRIVVRCYSAAR